MSVYLSNLKFLNFSVSEKKSYIYLNYNFILLLCYDNFRTHVVDCSGYSFDAHFVIRCTINMFFSYTAEEDFETADAVFDCIGDPPEVRFDLDFCANLLQKQYVS